MSTTDPTPGLSPDLLQRIRAALLRCPTLQSQAELAALATELAGGDPAAMLPHDPAARLAAMPTDRVPEVARSLPAGSRMPLRPNPLFVGREKELKALAHAIKGEGSATVIAQATTVMGMDRITAFRRE